MKRMGKTVFRCQRLRLRKKLPTLLTIKVFEIIFLRKNQYFTTNRFYFSKIIVKLKINNTKLYVSTNQLAFSKSTNYEFKKKNNYPKIVFEQYLIRAHWLLKQNNRVII